MVSFTGKKKFVKLSPEDGDVTTAAGGLVLNAQQTSVAFYSFYLSLRPAHKPQVPVPWMLHSSNLNTNSALWSSLVPRPNFSHIPCSFVNKNSLDTLTRKKDAVDIRPSVIVDLCYTLMTCVHNNSLNNVTGDMVYNLASVSPVNIFRPFFSLRWQGMCEKLGLGTRLPLTGDHPYLAWPISLSDSGWYDCSHSYTIQ